MAALRFRSWTAQMQDGSSHTGSLPRACGILDAVSSVVAKCGPDCVIQVELVTNYGGAHLKSREAFLSLVDTHLTSTISMQQTLANKNTRNFTRTRSKTPAE